MSGKPEDRRSDRGSSRFFDTRGVGFGSVRAGAALIEQISLCARARVESTKGKPPRGGGRIGLKAALAIMLSLLLVGSMAAPAVAASTSSSSAGPPGHVGVPSENVGPPEHAQGNGPPEYAGPPDHVPTEASAWGVSTSEHAPDLEVAIAGDGNGNLLLVASDESNHDGREIAVDASTLEDAVGEVPDVARVEHESGDVYHVPVEIIGDKAVIEVKEFSSNEITFSGTFSLTADPAVDGDTFSYEILNGSDVSNAQLNFTGKSTTSNQSASAATLDNSESLSFDVGGTETTTADITLTARNKSHSDGIGTSFDYNHTFSERPANVNEMYVGVKNEDYDASYTATVNIYVNGEQVASDSVGVQYRYDGDLDQHKETLTISGFKANQSDSITVEFTGNSQLTARWAEARWTGNVNGTAYTLDGQQTQLSNLTDMESVSSSQSLSPGSYTLSADQDWGLVDVNISYTEETITTDPSASIGGTQVASYSGKLSEGETASYSVDESNLKEGTNNISVLSTGAVGVEYSHESSIPKSIEYSGEAFSERYNVSRTWESDREDAKVKIPWASDRVIAVRNVGLSRNGSTVSDPTYSTENGTVIVNIGSVSAGETTTVSATGSKVQVTDGSIEVLEPTTSGEALDSKIKIVEKGSEFGIDVSGTVYDDRVHYMSAESWSQPDPYVVVYADGDQVIHPEGAVAGSTMRVHSSAVTVRPETGEAVVRIANANDPNFDPRLRIEPGENTGDSLEIVYHDTVPDQRYVLYSKSNDQVVDADTASSPVYFSTTDAAITYIIEPKDEAQSGPAVSGPAASGTGGGLLPGWAILLGAVSISVSGLFLVSRRFGGSRDRGVRGNLLLMVGGTVVAVIALELVTAESFVGMVFSTILSELTTALGGAATSAAGTLLLGLAVLLGLWLLDSRTEREIPRWVIALAGVAVTIWFVETLAPGALLGPLSSALEEVGPLVWLVLLGGGGFLAYRYIQAQRAPDTQVSLELGER